MKKLSKKEQSQSTQTSSGSLRGGGNERGEKHGKTQRAEQGTGPENEYFLNKFNRGQVHKKLNEPDFNFLCKCVKCIQYNAK